MTGVAGEPSRSQAKGFKAPPRIGLVQANAIDSVTARLAGLPAPLLIGPQVPSLCWTEMRNSPWRQVSSTNTSTSSRRDVHTSEAMPLDRPPGGPAGGQMMVYTFPPP